MPLSEKEKAEVDAAIGGGSGEGGGILEEIMGNLKEQATNPLTLALTLLPILLSGGSAAIPMLAGSLGMAAGGPIAKQMGGGDLAQFLASAGGGLVGGGVPSMIKRGLGGGGLQGLMQTPISQLFKRAAPEIGAGAESGFGPAFKGPGMAPAAAEMGAGFELGAPKQNLMEMFTKMAPQAEGVAAAELKPPFGMTGAIAPKGPSIDEIVKEVTNRIAQTSPAAAGNPEIRSKMANTIARAIQSGRPVSVEQILGELSPLVGP